LARQLRVIDRRPRFPAVLSALDKRPPSMRW
jgi:hypothetical protein